MNSTTTNTMAQFHDGHLVIILLGPMMGSYCKMKNTQDNEYMVRNLIFRLQ
jgi:hypothetical protein